MVERKTEGEIEAMREAGKVVADALAAVRKHAAVRVRLSELDRVARDVLTEAGATSPFLGYQPSFATSPFPAVVCTLSTTSLCTESPAGIALSRATFSASTAARSPWVDRRRCDLLHRRTGARSRCQLDRDCPERFVRRHRGCGRRRQAWRCFRRYRHRPPVRQRQGSGRPGRKSRASAISTGPHRVPTGETRHFSVGSPRFAQANSGRRKISLAHRCRFVQSCRGDRD